MKSLRWCCKGLASQLWAMALCAMTGTLCIVVAYLIIWPAYKNPIARMYTSKLGYATVIRKTNRAFPVKASTVSHREITGKFIGEGMVQSEPVQVPMIAMARISKVHVVEGQFVRKGDLIVELDPSRIEMKIESAKAAVQTAKAELERVHLGTVNVLQEERPEILRLRAESANEEATVAKKVLEMHRSLNEEGALSNAEFANAEMVAIRADLARRERLIAAETALQGRLNSVKIGESAVREAELTLAHRMKELEDYICYAPADGYVDRVLVHDGEYNQDPGRPAVLLASGTWFECYLDQTALGRVHEGDRVEVRLSAYQDRLFPGTISRIRPMINFATGGPESNRPVRPMGTGAPEWPATFSVRIAMDASEELIAPGLTGYATVLQKRYTLAVPRGTVTSVSGKRGIAFVVGEDGDSFEPRNVVVGIRDDDFVEIKDGLRDGEMVITDGYQVLEPGDRIAVEGNSIEEPLELQDAPADHPTDSHRHPVMVNTGANTIRYIGMSDTEDVTEQDDATNHRGRKLHTGQRKGSRDERQR